MRLEETLKETIEKLLHDRMHGRLWERLLEGALRETSMLSRIRLINIDLTRTCLSATCSLSQLPCFLHTE